MMPHIVGDCKGELKMALDNKSNSRLLGKLENSQHRFKIGGNIFKGTTA